MDNEFSAVQMRLQSAVDSMIQNISKNHIRPMQKQGYLCSAKCFENNNISDQQLEHCIQSCGHKVQSCSAAVQNEMNNFQARLQRCSQVCQVIYANWSVLQ